MPKTYNPTRISFEVSPDKKAKLLEVIPSGKMSRVYQNFTEYLLQLCDEDSVKVKKLVYITDIDYMEFCELAQHGVKESINDLINRIRISIGLSAVKTKSISGINRSLIEIEDAISNRRFL